MQQQVDQIQSLLPETDPRLIKSTLVKFNYNLDQALDHLLNQTESPSLTTHLDSFPSPTIPLSYQPYKPRNKSNLKSTPAGLTPSPPRDELEQLSEHL